nr:4486_t:CDS:2 [Entrophospora candida]
MNHNNNHYNQNHNHNQNCNHINNGYPVPLSNEQRNIIPRHATVSNNLTGIVNNNNHLADHGSISPMNITRINNPASFTTNNNLTGYYHSANNNSVDQNTHYQVSVDNDFFRQNSNNFFGKSTDSHGSSASEYC